MKKILCVLLILSFGTLAFAQDATSTEGGSAPASSGGSAPGSDWGLSFGLGTENVGGTLYQTLSLVPDIPLGPVGIGLNLKIHYQFYQTPGGPFGFYPRAEDWYDKSQSVQDNLDKYLSLIAYFRIFNKGDPFYFQIGAIQNGSLGNGFILSGYDNTILRPEHTYVGMALDLDGKVVNFPYLGLETFTANVSAFDVFGGRLFVRPLAFLDTPIIKDLEVGGTFVMDRDPYYYNPSPAGGKPAGDEAVMVYGGDLTLPVLTNPLVSMKIYGDVAQEKQSLGYAAGLGGGFFGNSLFYKLEGRYLGDNFIPTYFDQSYDLNRTQKYLVTQNASGNSVPAHAAYLGQLGSNIFKDMLVLLISVEGPFGTVNASNANDPSQYPQVKGTFAFQQKDFPISASAFYYKDTIKSWSDLVSAQNARIGAQLGYKFGAAVVSMVYTIRYIPQDDPAWTPSNQWEVTSQLQTEIKLK